MGFISGELATFEAYLVIILENISAKKFLLSNPQNFPP